MVQGGLRALAFAVLFLASPAWARPASWTCVISAELRGIPNYFLNFGRDAYYGFGEIACSQGEKKLRKMIQVAFHSNNASTGSLASSSLLISSSPVSIASPSEFFRSFTVVEMTGRLLDHNSWDIRINLQPRDLVFRISAEGPDTLNVTLSDGDFYISSADQPADN